MANSSTGDNGDRPSTKPSYNFTTHMEEVKALGTRFEVI